MPAIPAAAIIIPFILQVLVQYPNGYSREQQLQYKTTRDGIAEFSCAALEELPISAEFKDLDGILTCTNDVRLFTSLNISGQLERRYFTVNDAELIIGTTNVMEEASVFQFVNITQGQFHLEYTKDSQTFTLMSRTSKDVTCDHTLVLQQNATTTVDNSEYSYYILTGNITSN